MWRNVRVRGSRASISPHHIFPSPPLPLPLPLLPLSPTHNGLNPGPGRRQPNISLVNGTDFVQETEQDKGLSRHLLGLVHLCCGMEEVNSQGESSRQPSIAAAPSDMPESHQIDPAPSSSRENPQGGQPEPEERGQDEQQSSRYKASEIAGRFIEVIDPKSHVDTAAPINSVKGAVSKFGGILDWREKRLQLQDELDKVQLEVSKYGKRSQEAEAHKAQALQELDSTASAAGELRRNLERSAAEEAQARQEADLAELRLGEVKRGASESAAAKAELDVVRTRHAAAKAELQAARAELADLEKERADADAAAARARESAAASREAGKAVEDLAAELVALKSELESSSAAHGEAEEKRMALAAALEQDKSQWQNELEEAEQEAKRLREELMAACELEMRTEAAAQLLKSEEERAKNDNQSSSVSLMLLQNELQELKKSIDKARYEAECLRSAAALLRDNLAREKAELAALRRKEALSSASIASLEEELNSELAAAEVRATELHDHDESKMAAQLAEARLGAEEAKEKAMSAREELARVKEDASVAKATVKTVEARLEAVTREILAAITAEETATASANALLQLQEESKQTGVTLATEEYEELSRRAREMEDAAGKRVVDAVKLIKEAKDAEVSGLEKLKQLARQTEQRRRAMQAATEEAEEAEFAKMSAERELRQWQQQQPHPRTGLAEISALDYPYPGGNPHILSPRGGYYTPKNDAIAADARQKKPTFFPRMIMFLARKKAQSWK